MDTKTIIHLGLHKTGSTFLQEIVFPKLKTYTYLTRPYTQHNYAFNKLQYEDDSLFNDSEILEELDKINSHKLLISDESFSGKPLAYGYINRTMIARRLKKIFPGAEIILFLRGQQQILLSQYNMWVKGYNAGYRNIDNFLWYPSKNYTYHEYEENILPPNLNTLYWNTNKFYLHLDCYKYYELISLYKELFDKVHVFLYEEFVSNKEQVLHKIEDILEEKVNVSQKELNNKVNKSLSYKDLQKKIISNKVEVFTKNKYLRKIFSSFLRDRTYIDPEKYIKKFTRNVYEANNMKLIQKYPEVGIQNYPDEYKTATNRVDGQ